MLYLAMTGSEMERCEALPPRVAWMACRFSSYDRGLTNRPRNLPAGSVIIVDDQVPVADHDPVKVETQLKALIEEFQPAGILLDFQRPGCEDMVGHLATLPCPAAVSERYAAGLENPVFLSPGPLCRPLKELWPGREKWLDVPVGNQAVTLDDKGARVSEWHPLEPVEGFYHECLAVRYQIRCRENQAEFTLSRSPRELDAYMAIGKSLGITRFFCLYQEFSEK